jgi:phospholipid N-methyltransferase
MTQQERSPLAAPPPELFTAFSRTDPEAFLFSFLTRPTETGAVAPSSAQLACRMTEWLDLESASAVAELGPGTGAFTSFILERLSPHCRFFAVEINPHFAGILRRRFTGIRVLEGDVSDIAGMCSGLGVDKVDCIVSGLPWAAFSPARQDELLSAAVSVLRPGGQFVTFGYLQGFLTPGGRRFRRRLNESFAKVSRSSIVWGNLPPALVYRCNR